ncbi:MAG: hypothetical protein ACXWMI_07550, partial [Syntrophales bacterium]
MKQNLKKILIVTIILFSAMAAITVVKWNGLTVSRTEAKKMPTFDELINDNAGQMLKDGRQIFRFDTFGDQDFWGGQLQLHTTIAGAANGGVGPGLSPSA